MKPVLLAIYTTHSVENLMHRHFNNVLFLIPSVPETIHAGFAVMVKSLQ